MIGVRRNVFVAVALMGFAAISASASTIGYCVVSGGASCDAGLAATGAASTITATGNTGVALTGLAASDLSGLGVLWILNGDPGAVVNDNVAAIANFVSAGGILSFHDRNVNNDDSAGRYIPGAASVSFTFGTGANIDIVTPGTGVTNGPFGVITNATLDGGNWSNHGWADLATLPAGAVPIFSNGTASQIVDFYYGFGAGKVYYSSIPLDYYLAGNGNDPPATAMRTIYAPNEVAFQAGLGGIPGIPEPGTLVLLSGGLLALGAIRRWSRK